jgi:hypothetical protein
MSDGIDMDGALEALSSELPDENSVIEDSAGVENVVEDNQPEVESFTGFDPSTLPEDMQAVYRSMQGDYTRKTQEIAELRRQYESFSEAGVDADTALQADGSQPVIDETPDNNNSYEGLPPQLAAELEQMRAFREEMMQMQVQQETMAELEAMENTIRTSNPHYSDDDVEAIYSLAYSTDGDLMAAQELYAGIQQRMLQGYLSSKDVPHGATPAPSAPSSVPHRDFSNLDDAHKAAMEAIRNIS